jgi:hypothetical protein
MSKLGQKLIQRLKKITEALVNEEPIRVTEVTKIETPDGPMHLFEKKIWNEEEDVSDSL